jgi:hypothetical protein
MNQFQSMAIRQVTLLCHPWSPTHAVRGIHAGVTRHTDGRLALTFILEADPPGVRVPPPRPPRLTTELWQHTCFEAFIALDGATAYHEFNFAPSGEWAVYGFRGYRDGALLDDATVAPRIAVRAAPNRLEVNANVRLDRLSPGHVHMPLQLGLSAVIEASDHTLSYWSLHHAQARAVRLEPPGKE